MSVCATLVSLRRPFTIAARLSGTIAFALALAVAPAYAQADKVSHWGVSGSFTPQWKAHDKLQESLWAEGDGTIEGSEFTVGIVRGSTGGGDWGVSFVRKPVTNGTTITRLTEDGDAQFLLRQTHRIVFQDTYLEGVEFHAFIPFATIRNRVQVGLNLAGGIARTRGEVEETFDMFSQFRLPNGDVFTNTDTSSNTFPADEVVNAYQPLGKVEAQAAFLLAPSVKLKVGGGFNMPSAASFRVGVVFLIGAK